MSFLVSGVSVSEGYVLGEGGIDTQKESRPQENLVKFLYEEPLGHDQVASCEGSGKSSCECPMHLRTQLWPVLLYQRYGFDG